MQMVIAQYGRTSVIPSLRNKSYGEKARPALSMFFSGETSYVRMALRILENIYKGLTYVFFFFFLREEAGKWLEKK